MDALKFNLNDMEEYGKNLTPPCEIAALMDVPESELKAELENEFSPVRKAYMRGVAATAGELRKQNIASAIAGSPASIATAMQDIMRCAV
ncbi:MAG: hypothetical protein KBT34_01620 [Prevotella sp.]|nr:hypothetical protein [Candidatus Prevotella equi]